MMQKTQRNISEAIKQSRLKKLDSGDTAVSQWFSVSRQGATDGV